MFTLRDILNRSRWSSGDLHELVITVTHRGAPGDQRDVAGSSIVSIGGGGVELSEDPEAETAFVPYHRFLSIHRAGQLLWDRAGGERTLAPVVVAREPATLELGNEVLPTFSVVLRAASSDEPLVVDGSAGEGGGQILRSSLALSMLTGTPFVLERIRAGRAKPGLMRQHLTCVKAAAAVCGAEVEGASLGSTRLVFRPHEVRGGEHEFDVGSAGSAALVLQTVALPLSARESRVVVRGGTHALWAPIYPFLEQAWLPPLRQAGAELTLELRAVGFYPAGGGELVMTTSPVAGLSPLHLVPSSGELDLTLEAIVAGLPEGIARRELSSAAAQLTDQRVELRSATVRSPGPGNAIWLSARDRVTGANNVFSAIGEQGVSAEEVGNSVARDFLAWRASGASIEAHLADQLMLPIALAGEGSFWCHELSLHARTNIEVIHAFTGLRLRVRQLAAHKFRVSAAK